MRDIFKGTFSALNVGVAFVGLVIAGLGVYFAIEDSRYDVFGQFAKWATIMPAVLGSILFTVSVIALVCVKIQEKGTMLQCYAMLLLATGVVVIMAGVAQFTGVEYQLEIANEADQSKLDSGLMDFRHKLQSYDLGMYNRCCDNNQTALYGPCSAGGPYCYHDEQFYQDGLTKSSPEFCQQLNDKEELGLCLAEGGKADLGQFNTNLYDYVETTFLIPAYMLVVMGCIVGLTTCCACQAGIRNRTDPN